MNRTLLAVVAVTLVAGSAHAGAPAPPRSGPDKFARSEVVVAGKVTAIEKDTITTERFVGDKQKATYKIAVVRIESRFLGAEKFKEIRVGFVPLVPPDPKAKPPLSRPRPVVEVELKEGQELLFYLAKHPTADFYIVPGLCQPADLKNDFGKREVEYAKKFVAILADPVKALKADKPEARAEAAGLLVLKYRSVSDYTIETDFVAIPAEENTLILKALLEGDWSSQKARAWYDALAAYQAFYQLGLTERDGWTDPVAKPGADFGLQLKESFAKWLDGAGKDYQIKKVVPKKK